MAITFTDFTTYGEVRAVCGVSIKEVSDTELGLEIHTNALELALDAVTLPDEAPGPGPLKTTFTTIGAIAEGSRTTAQQKLYNLTRLYSTYAVAAIVARAMAMLAPKTVTDSKASLTRFSSQETWISVAENIIEAVKGYKYDIENINETSVTSPDYFVAVAPDTDRVLNE